MRIRLLTIAIAGLLFALMVAPSGTAQKPGHEVTLRTPVFRGAASLVPMRTQSQAAASSQASTITRTPLEVDTQATARPSSGPTSPSAPHPAPPGIKLSSIMESGTSLTFNGLDSVDSANVNPIFDIEPPDQGLCAGNGFVIETINVVIAVYDTTGVMLQPPTSMNSFFLQPFNVILTDPRCYYDAADGRFFVTIEDMPPDGRSYLDIAVSNDSNPLHGFVLFQIDTTDDGSGTTPFHLGCPCYGDQPLIGADEYGFFISTNEIGINTSVFNGAQIYAMSKKLLEGFLVGTVVQFGDIVDNDGADLAYSIQPATSPDPVAQLPAGAEFLLASRDFSGEGSNTLGVWAITNTSSLVNVKPNLTLQEKVVNTPAFYTNPNPATQKRGPVPLGASLGDREGKLNADDDRMQQVVFAGGLLHGALTTNDLSTKLAAIDIFRVKPMIASTGKLAVTGVRAVELSSPDLNLFYPAIAVNANNVGVITFDVSGPSLFPSAAFGHYNGATFTLSRFHFSAAGKAPEDGFTCHPPFSHGVCRWGDYSGAAWDPTNPNQIWIANEFISGLERETYTDWGTTISAVPVP
jgi:hypothetical protein